jgi:quercetin dioxygenase-like cupin family protein
MATHIPKPTPVEKLNDLPQTTTYITGHDDSTGKAIIASTRPATWQGLGNNALGFNVLYTTSRFPVSMNGDHDIATHDTLMASDTLGLVNPHGTVCRMVDFAPNSEPLMHRTQSLDYGIVIEGAVELILDSGESRVMKRGDVAVQRGTIHAWRNVSETEWCRMIFVLQDCEPLVVGGKRLGEDLAEVKEVIPASGNDG